MPKRRISDAVLTVLSQATIEGTVVRLTMQLERELSEQTNTVLEALGGKWNKKMNGYVFSDNPGGRLEAAMLTGEYSDPKHDSGFFPTPTAVVDRLRRGNADSAIMEKSEPAIQLIVQAGAVEEEGSQEGRATEGQANGATWSG